jgi:hypothetical protein
MMAVVEYGISSTMQCPQRKFMSCDDFGSSPDLASSLSDLVDRDLFCGARAGGCRGFDQ